MAYEYAPRIEPNATSYFSAPASELDPKLFEGTSLRSWVRSGILEILFDYLNKNFNNPHSWTRAWLAGSGVSYQWAAARQPGDLDCLVGIEYVQFRQDNFDYAGFSDREIAAMFNERFSSDIMPNTSNWEGYELTYYVNPQTDIRSINPYAAYDLIINDWTVKPDPNPEPPYTREWEQRTERDHDLATEIVQRYVSALNDIKNATNPAYKINAERTLRLAEDQAIALFDEIHSGRKIAFSQKGQGYSDFHNYRWQAGKRSGAIQALKLIKSNRDESAKEYQKNLYGIELPSADKLLRRTFRT